MTGFHLSSSKTSFTASIFSNPYTDVDGDYVIHIKHFIANKEVSYTEFQEEFNSSLRRFMEIYIHRDESKVIGNPEKFKIYYGLTNTTLLGEIILEDIFCRRAYCKVKLLK